MIAAVVDELPFTMSWETKPLNDIYNLQAMNSKLMHR